jgi:hypothetical protein
VAGRLYLGGGFWPVEFAGGELEAFELLGRPENLC